MKKIFTLFCICIVICLFNKSLAYENGTYKVIKVIDGDTLFLDFNKDGIPQQEEKVRLNGIDTFEVKPSVFLEWQMKEFNLTQSEVLGLGYLGKEFAKKNLLNKYVKAEYTGNTKLCDMGRQLMSIHYDEMSERNKKRFFYFRVNESKDRRSYNNGKNYEQEVLKAGLATVYKKSNLAPELYKYENLDKPKTSFLSSVHSENYKQACFFSRSRTIKANAKKTHRLNLVLLNKKNNTYHKVNCEYGLMASNVELIQKPVLPKHKPAGCCYQNNKKKLEKNAQQQKDFLQELIKQKIKMYFVNPLINKKPLNTCANDACISLLSLINNSKHSIDFAIYGIGGEDTIFNALVEAKRRGVIVRGVVDMNVNNRNPYRDTWDLINMLGSVVTDYKEDLAVEDEAQKKYKYPISSKDYAKVSDGETFYIPGAIMHDKFFIIDTRFVWTGSTNVSNTCMSYNSNNVIVIDSPEAANIYQKEFNQMFLDGKFHKKKSPVSQGEKIKLNDNTTLSVYFSPVQSPNVKEIKPLLDNAQNYIYVPMFFLTNRNLINSLIEAKNRNVDVKIIVDAAATKVNPQYIQEIRNNNVPIKVENWGGKMHMKSAIIDDKYIIIGSMNWTKSAQFSNDENTIILENTQLAKEFKIHFMYLWNSIFNIWLKKSPLPESKDSKNSCSDGVDNDHDGLYDNADPDCSTLWKRHHK